MKRILVRSVVLTAVVLAVLCTGCLCAGASGSFSLKFSGDETVVGYTGTPPATLEIPDGVRHIRNNSFKGCTEIETIILPDSIEDIGSWAFTGTGVSSVTIGSEIQNIGQGSFAECPYLENVEIRPRSGRGETRIEREAFRDCPSLTRIDIPETVTYLGIAAFQSCTSLRDVTNGISISEFGNNCFKNCTELSSVPFGPALKVVGNNCFQNCPRIGDVVLPDSIEEIGSWAFAQSGISSVVIGSGIRAIYHDAFAECDYLGSVDIRVPAGNSKVEIGNSAFRECPSLNRLTIPDTVTYIGVAAFKNCSNLTNVTLGSKVEELGNECFRNCSELSSVSFGQSLIRIGNECFMGCYKLETIVLPDSIEDLGIRAFSDSGATDVVIGRRIHYIRQGAFSRCPNLRNVAFRIPDAHSEIDIGIEVFNDCTSLETLYLPSAVSRIGRNVFDRSGVRDILYGGTSAEWENATKNARIPADITVRFETSAPVVPEAQQPAASSSPSPVLPGTATRPPQSTQPTTSTSPVAPSYTPAPTPSSVPTVSSGQSSSAPTPTKTPTPAESNEPAMGDRPGVAQGSGLEISDSSDGLILTGITVGSDRAFTSVDNVIEDLRVPSGSKVRIVDAQNRPCSGASPVATGDRIVIMDNDGRSQTITIVVTGDVCGTGKMGLRQVVTLAKAFTGAETLTGPYLRAGDFNKSDRIDIGDIVKEAQLFASSMH